MTLPESLQASDTTSSRLCPIPPQGFRLAASHNKANPHRTLTADPPVPNARPGSKTFHPLVSLLSAPVPHPSQTRLCLQITVSAVLKHAQQVMPEDCCHRPLGKTGSVVNGCNACRWWTKFTILAIAHGVRLGAMSASVSASRARRWPGRPGVRPVMSLSHPAPPEPGPASLARSTGGSFELEARALKPPRPRMELKTGASHPARCNFGAVTLPTSSVGLRISEPVPLTRQPVFLRAGYSSTVDVPMAMEPMDDGYATPASISRAPTRCRQMQDHLEIAAPDWVFLCSKLSLGKGFRTLPESAIGLSY
ncbi:uncharacterized protein CLUP02_07772 [Colletotrichum lupini]|uniref:Uncharacterized protein n=1 Tax=Colletotrichum lupini TaxID=145971 RepID=A0A9Q8SSJ1_9PEZI|nr:uncharacterized protein CLUP02_07772 [Colletotrichum lupini]UQC82285.1 hypothetical protein CLUP02_07772 [Colletotrichum lupini]